MSGRVCRFRTCFTPRTGFAPVTSPDRINGGALLTELTRSLRLAADQDFDGHLTDTSRFHRGVHPNASLPTRPHGSIA